MADILIHNKHMHIRGGAEAFQLLRDVLKAGIKFAPDSPSKETEIKTRKEGLVEGVSRAPVKPESKGGGGSISREEMQKIQQIIKEVTDESK